MYVKGQSGNPGGKPKGVKNAFTKELKSAILAVYHKKGGVKGLLAWANTNPTDFYKELLKKIPTDVILEGDLNVHFKWEGDVENNNGPL